MNNPFLRLKTIIILMILPLTIAGTIASGQLFANPTIQQASLKTLPCTTEYEAQKVVYHLMSGGGWFGRDHRHRLQNLENHFNALGNNKLTANIVLQGDGVDLLLSAKTDSSLQTRITDLRQKGAKFLICRNTLIQRKLNMDDLYGIQPVDLVGAGVAEVSRLPALGFSYIKF
jgi:uncharacterized protein